MPTITVTLDEDMYNEIMSTATVMKRLHSHYSGSLVIVSRLKFYMQYINGDTDETETIVADPDIRAVLLDLIRNDDEIQDALQSASIPREISY